MRMCTSLDGSLVLAGASVFVHNKYETQDSKRWQMGKFDETTDRQWQGWFIKDENVPFLFSKEVRIFFKKKSRENN